MSNAERQILKLCYFGIERSAFDIQNSKFALHQASVAFLNLDILALIQQ